MTDYEARVYCFKLKNASNTVFADLKIETITTAQCDVCETYGMPIEVYCPNTEAAITSLDNRVSGVTSDTLVAKDVIYNANIGGENTGLL